MFCIVANVQTDHVLRSGAKVYVIASDQCAHQVEVFGLNKSGRLVGKYIAWKRLTNIRASFIPPHVAKRCRLWWEDKETVSALAEELTSIWKQVRSFHPDGRMLSDGVSANAALSTYCSSKGVRDFTSVSPILPIEERLKEIRRSGYYFASEVPKLLLSGVPVEFILA